MKLRRSTAIACALAGALGVASSASALTINETFNGFYVEVGDTSNRGINLELFKIGPELWAGFVTGFTYDAAGNQVWFSGTDGQVRPGDTSIDFNINLATGGNPFGGAQEPSNAAVQGTGSLVVNNCNNVELNLNTDAGSAIPSVSDLSLDRGESLLGSIGIVGPDECAFQESFTACPGFSTPGQSPRTCVVQGTLTGDINFTNNTTWVLNGPVFIGGDVDEGGAAARLFVEPGTRIVGAAGNDFLGVQRGSQIIADGTPFAPIVMTGPVPSDDPTADAGTWGGLVINGRAPLNICDDGTPFSMCFDEGEGGSGTFGGDDPNDSSGVLRYVRVQFAGFRINDEDELNGIAFQGVGRNTIIDFIQVHENADDGIEFFGGTANAKHLLLTDIEDDSLDWTHGWNGNVQYVVVRQNQENLTETERGIEADNFEDDNDATPRAQPRIANVTFIGNRNATQTTTGFLFRRGTGVNMTNAIVTGFNNCIDLDSDATFTAAGSPGSLTGTLTIENTLIGNCDNLFEEEDGDGFTVQSFFEAQTGNSTGTVSMNGIFPAPGANISGFPLNRTIFPDFFDGADHRGAFPSEEAAWTSGGWTDFID